MWSALGAFNPRRRAAHRSRPGALGSRPPGPEQRPSPSLRADRLGKSPAVAWPGDGLLARTIVFLARPARGRIHPSEPGSPHAWCLNGPPQPRRAHRLPPPGGQGVEGSGGGRPRLGGPLVRAGLCYVETLAGTPPCRAGSARPTAARRYPAPASRPLREPCRASLENGGFVTPPDEGFFSLRFRCLPDWQGSTMQGK